jgi:hypothetical protein
MLLTAHNDASSRIVWLFKIAHPFRFLESDNSRAKRVQASLWAIGLDEVMEVIALGEGNATVKG